MKLFLIELFPLVFEIFNWLIFISSLKFVPIKFQLKSNIFKLLCFLISLINNPPPKLLNWFWYKIKTFKSLQFLIKIDNSSVTSSLSKFLAKFKYFIRRFKYLVIAPIIFLLLLTPNPLLSIFKFSKEHSFCLIYLTNNSTEIIPILLYDKLISINLPNNALLFNIVLNKGIILISLNLFFSKLKLVRCLLIFKDSIKHLI